MPFRLFYVHIQSQYFTAVVKTSNSIHSIIHPSNTYFRAYDEPACLLRHLYARQEATVRTGHGTTDWFQIGKGVHQGSTLSPCLFNFHAEYIMKNAGLDEAQAGIKIGRRNINNLRYADNTTLMAESKKELKSLLMKVKESEKSGLKLSIKKKQRSKHLVPSLHGK